MSMYIVMYRIKGEVVGQWFFWSTIEPTSVVHPSHQGGSYEALYELMRNWQEAYPQREFALFTAFALSAWRSPTENTIDQSQYMEVR